MITKSFKLILFPMRVSSNYNSSVVKKTTGDELPLSGSYTQSLEYYGISTTFLGIGLDDTPETDDDYRLGNQTTDLTLLSDGTDFPGIRTVRYDEPLHIITATRTYRNDTSDPITIKEVGLFSKPKNVASEYIMLARQVITPVTINPGESYTFQMSIDM